METLQIIRQPSESSVEFSVDSKGRVKPVVKVYDIDPEVALTKAQLLIERAVKHAKIMEMNNE